MMGPLPSSSAVSPQIEPQHGFWFGKLSTKWWERHPQAILGKHGRKRLMKNTYSASRANTEENNDIVRDGANNI